MYAEIGPRLTRLFYYLDSFSTPSGTVHLRPLFAGHVCGQDNLRPIRGHVQLWDSGEHSIVIRERRASGGGASTKQDLADPRKEAANHVLRHGMQTT